MPEYIEIYNQDDFDNRVQNSHLRICTKSVCAILIPQKDIDSGALDEIGTWDFSQCSVLMCLFNSRYDIPAGISEWNMSNVKHMIGLFSGSKDIPHGIARWNTTSTINMHAIFFGCISFNIPLAYNLKMIDQDYDIFGRCFSLKI